MKTIIKRKLSEDAITYEKALDYVDEAMEKLQEGHFEEALMLFNTALTIKPVLTAYVGKAKTFAQMGKFKDAFLMAEEAKKMEFNRGTSDFINLLIGQLKEQQLAFKGARSESF